MADPRNKPIYRVLRVTNPAAGAEVSITPNTGAGWFIRNLRFLFVTDANVANRHVRFTLDDGSGEYWLTAAGSAQAAGLSITYSAIPVGQATGTVLTTGHVKWPQDGLWVPQGHTLATSTSNIQIGDQYSGIAGLIWEFPGGPRETQWPFIETLTEESS